MPTTATALRKYAQELGEKGMSSASKATLVPAITEELERRAAVEKAAAKTGKLYSICGKRRPTTKNGKGFKDQVEQTRSVRGSGKPPSLSRAAVRYAAASASVGASRAARIAG